MALLILKKNREDTTLVELSSSIHCLYKDINYNAIHWSGVSLRLNLPLPLLLSCFKRYIKIMGFFSFIKLSSIVVTLFKKNLIDTIISFSTALCFVFLEGFYVIRKNSSFQSTTENWSKVPTAQAIEWLGISTE
jgi:hypothetical protein